MPAMDKQSLVLVDGSYYLFRAYHAMPEFTNARGEPTGALYGVVNMLRKLLREEQPDYFAVVFDAKGKSFRNDMYADYKAHRPPTPDNLIVQIEPLHEIIRALGLPLLCVDGVEADDVIATLAVKAQAAGMTTLISTGDKDLAQLVNDDIALINTMNNARYDRAGVIEKYGVPPERIIDYLAIIGDSTDNIPGVHKAGPKTAVKWLAEYGSLEGIIAAADSIKGKVGGYLRDSLHQLPLNKQLITLKTDVALAVAPPELLICPQDAAALGAHYVRWGFRSWLPELNGTGKAEHRGASAKDPAERGYITLLDESGWQAWLERIHAAPLTAFDTETTSLAYMDAELVGMSFATDAHSAAYLPLAHDYPGAPKQLGRAAVLAELRPWLESAQHKKVGQNLKYDKNVLARYGITLRGIAHDCMLQSYVLDSTAVRHDLDSLAQKYLDRQTTRYEDIAGKGAKQLSFNQIALAEAAPYAAEDADISLQLHQHLWPKLTAQKKCCELYTDIELPLLSVISDMERGGVQIDTAMLAEQSQGLAEAMQVLEQDAFELAGERFNIGSPKQIQAILYEKLGLPVLSRTPKGQPSTAEAVLQELAIDYPLPKLILEHRSVNKLKSAYTDKLPLLVNRHTGRVHTSYHQAIAATGRLSSSDPNLQNIPIRTEAGRKIRQAFTCPRGHILLAADYSQIELRIMAHLSGDETLLAAFNNNADIHQSTAAEVFALPPAQISGEQRRAAKAINFGLIYGMSAWGLAKQLGIQRSAAQDYVDRYFQRYPAVRAYMDKVREQAREAGYVETLFGRRLYVPEIRSRHAARRQYAERTAINAPMQGTAADIIKRAMLAIDRELLQTNDEIKMIMQVHDELVFEVRAEAAEKYQPAIARLMGEAALLDVPLLVDIGSGQNWDEAH